MSPSVLPSFALASYLAAQKERVEALLVSRLQRLQNHAPPRLIEAMRYSLVDGGKRLRPILCLAFAESVARKQVSDEGPAADAACAAEYIHTYSLIHDDLPAMDDDDLRRGRPTSHKVFGEAMAILAGDALLTEAFSLLAGEEGPGEPARALLCRELALGSGAGGMVGGQVLDIADDRPAEQAYLVRLHGLKTGALIRAACRMGVIAAGGSASMLEQASTYGEAVGLAFQIADDLLDVTSSAEALGKPTGADAAAGRHTFPTVVGLEASRVMAKGCVAKAIESLSELEPVPGPLAALAHYSIERVQ